MIAASFSIDRTADPIRKLDLTRDLNAVADLIELCFPLHLDPDGKTYVSDMRKAARNTKLIGWLADTPDLGTTTSSGFVWEEDDRIIGNLSLIPLQKEGRRVYLIANVAVHPDFRRRGIARKLTLSALSYLELQSASHVWLQVRDDNPPAVDLYRSLGFKEQAARTTWRIRPAEFQSKLVKKGNDLIIRRRVQEDWPVQCDWLETIYPKAIRWNLPVNFRQFTPGLLQNFANFMMGISLKHWVVTHDGKRQCVITWHKSDSFANNLWIALPDNCENEVLSGGLALVIKRLSRSHPLSIDFPANRCHDLLPDLGFKKFRTLIWMQRELPKR